MAKNLDKPRGIRNNNPGNIDFNPANKWQGQLRREDVRDLPSGATPRFVVFRDAIHGIRALAVLLINYQDKHGLKNVSGIIKRYAPDVENRTDEYVDSVARHMGVAPFTIIDLHQYQYLRPMIEAIIKHENGAPYTKWYTSSQIDKALVMAGVEPPKKPLTKSKGVQGDILAGAGATALINPDEVREAIEQISPYAGISEYAQYIVYALIILGIGLSIYSRWKLRRKGIA